MTFLPSPGLDVLTDTSRAPFRAAQRVAALGEGWTRLDTPPEGEVIWREDGDTVRLTPDGWLVYLNAGEGGFYAKRLRATTELIAAMRGGAGMKVRKGQL
jgi:hypothetical protein